MICKSNFILALLLVSFAAFSQNGHNYSLGNIDTTDMPYSAIWYSSTMLGDWGSGDCSMGINVIKVERDTFIDDRLCRVLGVTDNGVYLPESELVVFSKNGRMYFHEEEEWRLLYDFNANTGDTVTYYISSKYTYYINIQVKPDVFEQDILDANPYRLVITNIDTLTDENGRAIRLFHTDNLEGELFSIHHMGGRIVENMGSMEKLFGVNVAITGPECPDWPIIRCYSDDKCFIRFTDEACDSLVSTTDMVLQAVIIYPNPGSDIIIVENPEPKPLFYSVFNTKGQMISSGDLQPVVHNSIPAIDWAQGIYLILIRDNDGHYHIGKWIKI
jgi:hypothetical protein